MSKMVCRRGISGTFRFYIVYRNHIKNGKRSNRISITKETEHKNKHGGIFSRFIWRIKYNILDQAFSGITRKEGLNFFYGKKSWSKRTRYLNRRYFSLTNQSEKGFLTTKYCLTEAITTEFMTKPLQGGKFWQFRNHVLNIKWGKYQVHNIYISILYYMNTC